LGWTEILMMGGIVQPFFIEINQFSPSVPGKSGRGAFDRRRGKGKKHDATNWLSAQPRFGGLTWRRQAGKIASILQPAAGKGTTT